MNDYSRYIRTTRRIFCCAVLSFAAIPATTLAQTLNDATTAQLAADAGFTPCAQLLSGDAASVLGSGGLFAICTRQVGAQGDPSSSSGGGFAATPPSAASVVEERLKDEDDSGQARRGFFFSVGYDSVDRDVSTFEDGYDSDVVKVFAGFDFLVKNSWILGFVIDGSKQDGDFVDGGDFETQTIGLTGFGSIPLGENGAFDFYAGYSDQSNERQRRATFTEVEDGSQTFRVAGAPTADFDSNQILAGLQLSYDWVYDNVTLGPRIGYGWGRTDYDTYDEVDSSGLALRFHDDEETSSQFYGGIAGTAAISTKIGAVVLDQSVLYRYETDQDQRSVEISFVEDTRSRRFTYQTEVPDRDFLEFTVGATLILQNGLQLMFDYRGIGSHRYLSTNGFSLGFRKEF